MDILDEAAKLISSDVHLENARSGGEDALAVPSSSGPRRISMDLRGNSGNSGGTGAQFGRAQLAATNHTAAKGGSGGAASSSSGSYNPFGGKTEIKAKKWVLGGGAVHKQIEPNKTPAGGKAGPKVNVSDAETALNAVVVPLRKKSADKPIFRENSSSWQLSDQKDTVRLASVRRKNPLVHAQPKGVRFASTREDHITWSREDYMRCDPDLMEDPELSRAAWAIECEQENRRMAEDRWSYLEEKLGVKPHPERVKFEKEERARMEKIRDQRAKERRERTAKKTRGKKGKGARNKQKAQELSVADFWAAKNQQHGSSEEDDDSGPPSPVFGGPAAGGGGGDVDDELASAMAGAFQAASASSASYSFTSAEQSNRDSTISLGVDPVSWNEADSAENGGEVTAEQFDTFSPMSKASSTSSLGSMRPVSWVDNDNDNDNDNGGGIVLVSHTNAQAAQPAPNAVAMRRSLDQGRRASLAADTSASEKRLSINKRTSQSFDDLFVHGDTSELNQPLRSYSLHKSSTSIVKAPVTYEYDPNTQSVWAQRCTDEYQAARKANQMWKIGRSDDDDMEFDNPYGNAPPPDFC